MPIPKRSVLAQIASVWSRDCKVMMRMKTDGPLYHIKDVQDIDNPL